MTFEPTRTLLAQQSYPGSIKINKLEKRGSVSPPGEAGFTVYFCECPECGATGKVKSYHGSNCFWDCEECGQALKG